MPDFKKRATPSGLFFFCAAEKLSDQGWEDERAFLQTVQCTVYASEIRLRHMHAATVTETGVFLAPVEKVVAGFQKKSNPKRVVLFLYCKEIIRPGLVVGLFGVNM